MKYKNVNKAKVREIDLKYISNVARQRKLKYFGLPGSGAFDVEDWKEYIETVHAVEWDGQKVTDLHINLIELGFSKDLVIFSGDICDVIENSNYIELFVKYNLINLDFTGVLVSRSSSDRGNRKINAIKKLLEDQSRKFDNMEELIVLFTFYGTRNESSDLDEALNLILDGLKNHSNFQNSNIEEICNWVRDKGKQYHKIIVVFPVLFFSNCPKFLAICKEIVFYIGDGNSPMVHFIFKLTRKRSGIEMASMINIQKMESIPLQKIKHIKDGEIEVTNLDIPEFRII